VLAGSGLLSTAEDAAAAADKIGYPVLLKATGGGGGRGIFICRNAGEVLSQFSISQKQGEQFFGNSGVSGAGKLCVYIERGHPASAGTIQSCDSPKLGISACVRTAKKLICASK
jgi:biotin carboxylase